MDISSSDWTDWIPEEPRILLHPELSWEGSNAAVQPSIRGEVGRRVNQLRDPFLFKDEDDQLYLLYTGGGESAIGIVKINR